MPGFGMIHDLAKVEVDIRRKLQEARHNLDCAKHRLGDKIETDLECRNDTLRMMGIVDDILRQVIGD